MSELFERAARLGIATEYRDGFGESRRVEPQVLARLVAALGDQDRSPRIMPQTVVLRAGSASRLRLSAGNGVPLDWQIHNAATIAAGTAAAPDLELPADLPNGIFRLQVTLRGPQPHSEDACLLVAPRQVYQGHAHAPARLWALTVQLYALRSRRNWGHGDFSDLLALIDLAADLGASGIGLNPLHALFDDRPDELSPYFPNSRLFLNPLYIAVDEIAEFPGLAAAGVQDTVERLRGSEMLDYHAVASVKMSALRLAYDRFCQGAVPERRAAFDAFRRQHPLLARFACFEHLRRKFASPWWEWPPEWRTPDPAALLGLREREAPSIGFFEFLQWSAHEQLDRASRRARERRLPIGLYLDIAVGVRNDSFDAWCDQQSVLSGMAVGAPPDFLNTTGQNWGLAGFNPVGLEQQGFAPFRAMLQASMRYAGAIRLDHVLGLQRLYLVPQGMPASGGTYIRLPFEALLAVTALTSVAHNCLVIGEDLGTVPENFRETLADWGIWSYQVMLFERGSDGAFVAPERYRQNAVVTFGTHDTATYAGWRAHHDLAVKRALQFDPRESDADRRRAVALMDEAVQARGVSAGPFAAVARYLAEAPSRLLAISCEDLLDMKDQVNLPGTMHEHPNWRRRPPVGLEELATHGHFRAVADIMRAAGRSSAGTAER